MAEMEFVHWMAGYGWGLATILILVAIKYLLDEE